MASLLTDAGALSVARILYAVHERQRAAEEAEAAAETTDDGS